MLFRAREIREGSSPEEMRRQLNEALKLIERDLVTALARPKISEVITASTYAPSFGEVARVAPPSTGLALVLPEPNLARLSARITVVQEAASGAMTVEVVNGTINGATMLSFLAGVGTVEFILTETGWYGWSVSLVNDLPLTALADQIAESFLGNFTAGAAPPAARAGSSVAGGGLTYTAGGTLAVGAGTGLTVNANDVAVTIPLTDGDKGDITVASSGTAWTIDASAVTTAKLADGNVTPVKLAGGVVSVSGLGPHHDVALSADTVAVRVETTSTITGFTGGFDGRTLDLYSVGVTPTLDHGTGSSAGNQINCPTGAAVSLGLRGGARFIYHNGGWRVVGSVNT